MKFSISARALPVYLALFFRASLPSSGLAQTATTEPLLQQANLVYQGAFRLPQIPCNTPPNCFAFGGTALAYNAADHSLYIIGHRYTQLTAEISIPTLVNSPSPSDLNVATVLQPLTDALDGERNDVNPTDPNAHLIGGQLVYGGRLIIAVESYYDAADKQKTSHFARPLNLATAGPLIGPVTVGSQYPGWVSGYMTTVPPEWQSLLGGPALTGNCCLAITSIQSNGPALSVFDPAAIGTSNPVPAVSLVGYPHTLPLGSGYNTQSTLFNGTTMITGVVFPAGTRSVLFFGRQGVGPFCYGPGTLDTSLAGTVASVLAHDKWCYDPAQSGKGTHAYPYVYQVWAYDANDLLAVKNGSKQPYEIQPYATWTLTLPFESPAKYNRIGGAAYDPQDDLIYVSQMCGDSNCNPIIHAFKVTLGSAAPEPPKGVIAH